MLFKQLFDHETWTYTYLIADPLHKEALLIDPVKSQINKYCNYSAKKTSKST